MLISHKDRLISSSEYSATFAASTNMTKKCSVKLCINWHTIAYFKLVQDHQIHDMKDV